MHSLGIKVGQEKAKVFRLASVVLNPGLVGLHVLDALTAGLPIVSTRQARHSPEVAYVKDGTNGVLTDDSAEAYASQVIKLLIDAPFREMIAANARQDGHRYTVDRMAQNFVSGIEACLALA